ncbi:trehalase isoform X1 [Folsomia candida]|uniref:trehalase isoform X1 n=1 Tax=Folsomia candida TaxID=158441 RepID=UPI001604C89D|nr:trehalase isoform X1 [Folsomia candida]
MSQIKFITRSVKLVQFYASPGTRIAKKSGNLTRCSIQIRHLASLRQNRSSSPISNDAIYCHGLLLHTVQMSGLFPDSKTFVDMKLKTSPDQVLRNFDAFMKAHKQKPTRDEVGSFVAANFDEAGSEFAPWNPTDWHPDPQFIKNITDPHLQVWATQIHSYWKELGRKIKDDVKNRAELYSMIYTSHPVIVPGGRFREFFYWDSYWIMKGLLLSEMGTTVRGMLENFVEMVNLLGYVPNGGRIYFRRSQPPFLTPMVKLYLDHTKDIDFVRTNLPVLEKEFNFWVQNRSLTVQSAEGKSYRVMRYNVELTGPRPESYREDFLLADKLNSTQEKDELYFNLKSGAESGWDFSSRWFINPSGDTQGNLSHTKVRDIIPVELNALTHLNAKLLADFHRMTGAPTKAAKYESIAHEWKTMINELLWDEEEGCWFDFEIATKTLRKEFYPSNVVPLWTGSHNAVSVVNRVVGYLRRSGALAYPGGIPTSLTHAGEQWDFPNGWAPLQHLIVDALDNTGNLEAKALAFEIAEKWIATNYAAFKQGKDRMFEKYDVTVVGLPGGGGEYDVVVGFGWTNGVALDFLNRYGGKISVSKGSGGGASHLQGNAYMANSLVFGSVSLLLASILGISQVGRCKEGCKTLGAPGGEYEELPLGDGESDHDEDDEGAEPVRLAEEEISPELESS